MAAGRTKLRQQFERIPMDAQLRKAVLAGVEQTDDGSAALEATALNAALDALPELADRLRRATGDAPQNITAVATPARTRTQVKTIRIRQVRSGMGCPAEMRETLKALGLGRMNKVSERPDSKEVRGMIAKIPHLVTVVK